MAISLGSRKPGPYLALVAATAFALTASSTVLAESVAKINGVDIDSVLFDMYLTTRTQKSAEQATPEERDAVLRELKDIYLLTTQPIADELAKSDLVKAQIELQGRGVLAQAVAQDFFSKNEATDDEILAEYRVQMAAAPPLQYKARHILVDTQAAAADLIVQLQAGADFQELAKTHSTGPSGPNGGDLGWFAPDRMVEPFSDAVASLEDGAFTTEPVQTQFGWHVILREESRANEPPTLESVRDNIKQRVEQNKFQSYIEKLRASNASAE